MSVEICRVRLGSQSYDIHIGESLLENVGALLRPHLERDFAVIITDRNVEAAQGARLSAGLRAGGIEFATIVVEPGEGAKSFDGLESVLNRLIELGVERRDLVIAFGGGVVGDLAGFASAILRRGCRFAQVPTTLLAQVDSSVGGKTGVNAARGKNLIGAFHQPEIVIADLGALQTLPQREMRAGYAEIVKYGALGDEPFFAWLEKRGLDVIAGDVTAQRIAIKRSCEAKAEIVAADEKESGVRALLNLGHTFGHSLEAACGFSDRLLHGEAVAAGLALAFDFSVALRICPSDDAMRLKTHLCAVGLPSSLAEISQTNRFSADELLAHMMQDKKVERGSLTFILVRRLGEAFIEKNVNPETVRDFLIAAGARG